MQLVALEEQAKLALLDAAAHQPLSALAVVTRLAVLLGRVDTTVPDDDLASAVFAPGDHPLERAVLERMILCLHRQAAFAMRVGGPVGNRPGLQDPVGFESKVVVQPPRRVL